MALFGQWFGSNREYRRAMIVYMSIKFDMGKMTGQWRDTIPNTKYGEYAGMFMYTFEVPKR